jgi:hypothetical protein
LHGALRQLVKNVMRRLAFGLTLATLACGGSTVSTPDVQSFSALVAGVSTAVNTYATQAQAANDIAGCNSAEASYDAKVRPTIEQMQNMAGPLDQYMESNGRMTDGDMGCSTAGMLAELDYHKGIACTSSANTNQSEAQRDVDTMHAWTTHLQGRVDEMNTMMSGGMMGGHGQMATCVHEADGGHALP